MSTRTRRHEYRRSTAAVVAAVAVAAALTGCGGDDDATAEPEATDNPAPVATAAVQDDDAPSATATATATAAASVTGTAVSTAAATETSDAPGPPAAECPANADVSAVYGAEMALDEESAMTGAIGLVFCPYEEVVPPDVTTALGLPKSPDFFSLTFTDQNPVVDDGSAQPVDGLGEQAIWSDGAGELAVWTGERGLIVSVTFPPPSGDSFAVAGGLAGIALGVDASGAMAAPADAADPAGVEASAGECPAAEDVGAIAGVSVALDDDLSVHEQQFTTCWYQPDDPAASGPVYLEITSVPGVIVSEYEAEEIPGIGETTWWQEEISTLTVWTDSLSVSVAMHNAMSHDERIAASIAVAELVI